MNLLNHIFCLISNFQKKFAWEKGDNVLIHVDRSRYLVEKPSPRRGTLGRSNLYLVRWPSDGLKRGHIPNICNQGFWGVGWYVWGFSFYHKTATSSKPERGWSLSITGLFHSDIFNQVYLWVFSWSNFIHIKNH